MQTFCTHTQETMHRGHPHFTNALHWIESTWTKLYHTIFNLFKIAIEASVILHFPDYSLPSIISSDSPDYAVGAATFQEYPKNPDTIVHQPIAYASHKYSGSIINWDTSRCTSSLCVVLRCHYLRGNEFFLGADHLNVI